MRVCVHCRDLQPDSEFRDRPNKKPYPIRTRVCRTCERDQARDLCPTCGMPKWKKSRQCGDCDGRNRTFRPSSDSPRNIPCPDCGQPMQPRSRRCFTCSRSNRTDWTKVKTGPKAKPPVERFASKCVPGPTVDHCIHWRGTVGRSGYGYFTSSGDHAMAHQWAYRIFVGDIPKGMSVDHLCRNVRCVNPLHLELCSRGENSRRGAEARERERRLWRYVREHHPHVLEELSAHSDWGGY